MLWNVYLVPAPKLEPEYLGQVEAPHAPAAIMAGWKRWADEIDENQVQGGFYVRLVLHAEGKSQ